MTVEDYITIVFSEVVSVILVMILSVATEW